jgi:5-methylcytosine-specific restriction endonuclease McrA
MAKKSTLAVIHGHILAVFQENPGIGLTIHEIRSKLPGDIGPQEQLDRRIRDLRSHHDIPWKSGKYYYKGVKATPLDNAGISGKLRAAVMNKAHGRCQMCGKTVAEDGVTLEADHKIPRTWGGQTAEENLWAICRECNNGKRDHFASFDAEEMKQIVALESVYERIAHVLHKHLGSPVASWFLEFVANLEDFQEDWQKRLRELRYPPIGYKIKATRTKSPSGKWIAAYQLDEWHALPADHKFLIKEHERQTKKRRNEEQD